jgi:diacylglycerol O-acyltransferase-1
MSDYIPTFEFSKEEITEDFYSVRPEFVLFSWLLTVVMSYLIEAAVVRGYIRGRVATVLHVITGAYNLIFPVVWVTVSKSHPGYCMLYLLQSTILWMKLISYAHVNREMRIIKALELEKCDSEGNRDELYNNSKPLTSLFAEIKDLEPPFTHYPANINLLDILYFSVAPTLCYQLNYPRLKTIRWKYVASLVLRLLLVLGLMLYMVGQHVKPTLDASMAPVRDMDLYELFVHLLKLSIPNTYVWLLSFYLFFHLWLNLLAELTRFGDRQFYREWWNARTIDKYWRTWNLPVHNWLLRHMYYPL